MDWRFQLLDHEANARKRLRTRKENDMFSKQMIGIGLAAMLTLGGARTAAAQAEIDALVFWDVLSTNKTARACRDLGYTLTEARSSETEFIAFLNAQPWDFVGIELPWDLITQKETVAQLLEDHVAAGGRLLVNFNNLDEWPRLQRLMGVESATERPIPEDVIQTNPPHPGYPFSLAGWFFPWITDPWADRGDYLAPASSGIIAATFESMQGAVIIANDEHTIVNGFDWDSYPGGASTALAKYQITYLMRCPADFDQTTGLKVLDIFDFLEFQRLFIESNYRANMAFDANLDIFDYLAFQNPFVTGCN